MKTSSNKMHVIVVPSWYPTKLGPGKGIFFKAQAIEEIEKDQGPVQVNN